MADSSTAPSTQSGIETNPTVPGNASSIPQSSSTQGGPASTLPLDAEEASLAALEERLEQQFEFWVLAQKEKKKGLPGVSQMGGKTEIPGISMTLNIKSLQGLSSLPGYSKEKPSFFVERFQPLQSLISTADWKKIPLVTLPTKYNKTHHILAYPKGTNPAEVQKQMSHLLDNLDTSLMYGIVLHLAKHSLTLQGANLFIVVNLVKYQRAVHPVRHRKARHLVNQQSAGLPRLKPTSPLTRSRKWIPKHFPDSSRAAGGLWSSLTVRRTKTKCIKC
jgi:hypothetical protein